MDKKNLVSKFMVFSVTLLLFIDLCVADESVLQSSSRPMIRAGTSSSTNWAGYAVTGSAGAFSDVKGSWVVPSVTCGSSNQYSSFWTGIDGYNSGTVEQTGIDADCNNGAPKYYAWYEFYPKLSKLVTNLAISPGNVIFGEVKYAGNSFFTVLLNDVTTGQSFSTTQKLSRAQRSSAEWITEAPYSGGVLPLANFGTASYGFDNTGIANTSYASIFGRLLPIGSFGSVVQQISMVTSSGALKAQPSVLTSDGTSFNTTWLSAGP